MINTVGQISNGIASGTTPAPKIDATPEISFSEVLSSMANNTVTAVKEADNMAVQGLMGKADTRQVVDAVIQAEQALQTSIAVRDKIVTAYLEISRMAI